VSGSVACNRAGGKISRQIQRGIIRKGVGYGWNNFFGCTQVCVECVSMCVRVCVCVFAHVCVLLLSNVRDS